MRHQNDGLQEQYSNEAGIDFTDTDVITRQEYLEETKTENILAKYGVMTPMRQMTYGKEIDDRIDLQQALWAIAQARTIRPPDELAGKYPSWQSILNAVESGAYQHDLNELEIQKEQNAARKAQEASSAASTDTAK